MHFFDPEYADFWLVCHYQIYRIFLVYVQDIDRARLTHHCGRNLQKRPQFCPTFSSCRISSFVGAGSPVNATELPLVGEPISFGQPLDSRHWIGADHFQEGGGSGSWSSRPHPLSLHPDCTRSPLFSFAKGEEINVVAGKQTGEAWRKTCEHGCHCSVHVERPWGIVPVLQQIGQHVGYKVFTTMWWDKIHRNPWRCLANELTFPKKFWRCDCQATMIRDNYA